MMNDAPRPPTDREIAIADAILDVLDAAVPDELAEIGPTDEFTRTTLQQVGMTNQEFAIVSDRHRKAVASMNAVVIARLVRIARGVVLNAVTG